MKRLLVGALFCAALASSAFSQTVIWDNVTGATTVTTTGSTPSYMLGDSMDTILSPGWMASDAEILLFVVGAQTVTNLQVRLTFFDVYNAAGVGGAGTAVSASQLYQETFALGPLTTTGNAVFSSGVLTFTTGFSMSHGGPYFWTSEFFDSGVRTTTIKSALRDGGVTVGTGSNGFYRDANDNGVCETTDARTLAAPPVNHNMCIKLRGNAVPEPATFVVMGAGVALLAARRRRK